MYTLNESSPVASAFLVSGGRFVAVSVASSEKAFLKQYANIRKIDAEGRTIIPGLIDSHGVLFPFESKSSFL